MAKGATTYSGERLIDKIQENLGLRTRKAGICDACGEEKTELFACDGAPLAGGAICGDCLKESTGPSQIIEKVFSKREATTVTRGPGPWIWPEVCNALVSDSFKVLGMDGLRQTANNGDPLKFAYAINMLESLYRLGYAVVKMKTSGKP